MPLVNGVLNSELPANQTVELEQKKLQHKKEELLRSEVFEAVSSLTETVSEAKLKNLLPILDTNSWDSVVEERFLFGVCGWPLCRRPVTVSKLRAFKLDQHQGKVYQHYSTKEKYCSLRCMNLSDFLRPQLSELPLFLTGERHEKCYNICPTIDELIANYKSISATKDSESTVEFVPDKLLTQMKDLFIAENAESDLDSDAHDEDDEDPTAKKKRNPEDAKFLKEVQSFVTAKSVASTAMPSTSDRYSTAPPLFKQKQVCPTSEEAEAKLAKLREKYGKNYNHKIKRPPIIIEPHNEALLKLKTLQIDTKRNAETAMQLLAEWITPSTICFLSTYQEPRKPVEGEGLYEQFVSSIMDPRQATLVYERKQETDTMKLPLVDKVDQHLRRVDIVVNAVKNPWVIYVSKLKLAANFTECKNMIATFNLTRNNVVVSPNCAEYLAIALFHLMILYNPKLRALAELEDAVQNHKKIMESDQLEVDFFSKQLKTIIEKVMLADGNPDAVEHDESSMGINSDSG